MNIDNLLYGLLVGFIIALIIIIVWWYWANHIYRYSADRVGAKLAATFAAKPDETVIAKDVRIVGNTAYATLIVRDRINSREESVSRQILNNCSSLRRDCVRL
jgi:hypothetical protein